MQLSSNGKHYEEMKTAPLRTGDWSDSVQTSPLVVSARPVAVNQSPLVRKDPSQMKQENPPEAERFLSPHGRLVLVPITIALIAGGLAYLLHMQRGLQEIESELEASRSELALAQGLSERRLAEAFADLDLKKQ